MISSSDASATPLRWLIAFLGSHGLGKWSPSSGIFTPPPDAARVVEKAAYHRVIPLLHMALRQVAGNPAFADLASAVAPLALQVQARNVVLEHEAFRIADAFEQHDIPSIPFKGPTLARQAYGDVALRQFEDLDFLVKRPQIPTALAILEADGYGPVQSVSPAELAFMVNHGWDICLRHRETGIHVELASTLAPEFHGITLDADTLLPLSQTIRQESHAVRALPADVLFVCLAIHAGKHLWDRLVWACDMAALLSQRPPLEADRCLAFANEFHVHRFCLAGVLVAQRLWPELLIPPAFADASQRDPNAGRFADACLATALADVPREYLPDDVLRTLPLRRLARERFADQLGLLVRICFSPTLSDYQCCPLPPAMEWLYTILRPLRLVFSRRRNR